MGRFFSIVITLAVIGLGGAYLWMQRAEEEARARISASLSSARRTFADQARAAVSDESDAYLTQVKAALAAYEEELSRVYEGHTDWWDPEAYRREVEARFAEGGLKEAQKKSMLEGYGIVKDAYDTLMKRDWRPVLTAHGPGDVRVDVYGVERTRDEEGNPILEGKALFWGVEDSTRVGWGGLSLRYWVKRTKAQRRSSGNPKEIQEVLGRVDGESTPRIIIQKPAAYIPQFPSYVSIGRIWLPVMPREAHAVDIEYGFTARRGGDLFDVFLKWPRWPIPDRWKLQEGEVWEADVVEATDEEIAGTDPEP